MTETELQDLVLKAAEWQGWLVYHTHDSRRSSPGFPDLAMVRRDRAVRRLPYLTVEGFDSVLPVCGAGGEVGSARPVGGVGVSAESDTVEQGEVRHPSRISPYRRASRGVKPRPTTQTG